MSGLVVVHDGSLMNLVFTKALSLDLSPGQDLFAYKSGDSAIGAYSKWKDVSAIVVHKDLDVEGGAVGFIRSLEKRAGVGVGELPFCVVVTSGEANYQGVSEKVMHDIRADVLTDLSVIKNMDQLSEIVGNADHIMSSRIEGNTRGESVIVYTYGHSRIETQIRSFREKR